MKRIKAAVLSVGLLTCLFAVPASAQGVYDVCPPGVSSSSAICADESEATDIVKNIINIFLTVIGALSVIMIIHSGFKYVTSRGDAEQIKSAKNTLFYAVTGLVVAVLAFAIVNFVLGAFS